MQIRNSTGYFYSPAILFNSMYWHVLSSHLILLVKTHIIFNSLHEVRKQTTFKNVKWDNGCRENRATITWFHLSALWSRCFHANFVIKWRAKLPLEQDHEADVTSGNPSSRLVNGCSWKRLHNFGWMANTRWLTFLPLLVPLIHRHACS